jgi:hypothetical protein
VTHDDPFVVDRGGTTMMDEDTVDGMRLPAAVVRRYDQRRDRRGAAVAGARRELGA